MPTEKVTFCRICEPLCGMVATVEGDRITKLRPDPDHPLSRGYACPKGIAMQEVQNDPDRVTHPLRRTASGEFEQVSWEVALDDIGARLVIVVDPMLATGNSAIAALSRLKESGATSIKYVCLLASPEGLAALRAAHPDVPVVAAALDERLNEHGYIVPGLGDAGDRMCGTK